MSRRTVFLEIIATFLIAVASIFVFWAAVSATAGAAPAVNVSPAESIVRAHGLEHRGDVWCLPQEIELHNQLGGLERLEQRLFRAQQIVDQMIAQNDRWKQEMAQLAQVEQQARARAAKTPPGTPQRAQLDAEAKAAAAKADQCRRQYIRPQQLGMAPPLKLAIVDLITVRNELMLRLLSMRREMDELTHRYEALRQDSGLMAAITSAGTSQSLGGLKSLREQWKIVDKMQPLLFGDTLPVAREGSSYCVTVIVDDHEPLTFSFLGTAQNQVLIPQNLAEACGLHVDVHAGKRKVRLAKGRDVVASRTRIAQLRFGRQIFRNVDAFILPPEAADIGARIGTQAFAGHQLQLDAEHLTLTLAPAR
jgi:hypothetical protein